MQKQVSLETAKKLKEAGWSQEQTEHEWWSWSDHASAEHVECHDLHWELGLSEGRSSSYAIAAPDTTELLEALPENESLEIERGNWNGGDGV